MKCNRVLLFLIPLGLLVSACSSGSPDSTITTAEIDTLPPVTTTTLPVPVSARFKYSYKKPFPWPSCFLFDSNECGETQVTLSGAIVPNATAEKSEEERGVLDVYWECRDCSITIENLDLDYPTDVKNNDWSISVWYTDHGGYAPVYFWLYHGQDNDPLDITLSPGETVTVPLFAADSSMSPELWKKVQPLINGAKPPTLIMDWGIGPFSNRYEDFFGPSYGETPNQAN